MLLIYLAAIDDGQQRKTFEYFYLTYRSRMFSAADRLLHSNEDAEDAVHNAFLGIAKHADVLTKTDEDYAAYYMIKAARNAAISILRKNSKSMGDVSVDELYNVSDGNGIITAGDARLILRCSAGITKLGAGEKTHSDVNSDGVITAQDARRVLRMSALLV